MRRHLARIGASLRQALFTPYMRTAGLTLLLLLGYLLAAHAGWLGPT